MSDRPQKVFRLTFEQPLITSDEWDTGYPGGDPVDSDDDPSGFEFGPQQVRYYVTRSGLNRKLRELERWSDARELKWEPCVAARVLSIEEGTIDWTAPDGHGAP